MHCPGCAGHNSKVLESRIADAGDAMRRRRECLDCAHRFTTYERIEQAPLWVDKIDGRQEPFDAQKLFYVFRMFQTNVKDDLLENSWTPTNTSASSGTARVKTSSLALQPSIRFGSPACRKRRS